MQEIYSKNERSRVAFLDTHHLLKRPRNPTTGELTSREDAEYLVPLSSIAGHAAELKQQEAARTLPAPEMSATEERLRGTTMFSKLLADVARCESLRQRRDRIDQETALVATILKHKQVCANAGLLGRQSAHKSLMNKTVEELTVPPRPY